MTNSGIEKSNRHFLIIIRRSRKFKKFDWNCRKLSMEGPSSDIPPKIRTLPADWTKFQWFPLPLSCLQVTISTQVAYKKQDGLFRTLTWKGNNIFMTLCKTGFFVNGARGHQRDFYSNFQKRPLGQVVSQRQLCSVNPCLTISTELWNISKWNHGEWPN